MNEDKTVRVYIITGSETEKTTKNYIKSIKNGQMLFGTKDEAEHFTPTQAETLQRMLYNNLGNGHIEFE